ncbi:MAG TPA: hypothetical protein VMI94_10030 [Bryobacteraceae bacterium]|nr:hypothetical protein [Bryobacteraceae bacterium]
MENLRWRAAVLWLGLCGVLAARYGTVPKRSEQDYPAHARLNELGVGAEYLVHSFSSGNEMYIARDFLVVEVAFFPAKGQTLTLGASQFALVVNGKKPGLGPQSAEFVASSLRHPDQQQHPGVEAGVGPVIFGAPRPGERFPGDPTAPPPYPAPRVPDANPTGAEQPPPVTADELAVQAALPEGEHHGPVSGYLYFPFRGKTKHIHRLNLEFTSPAGSITLPLLQP